MYTGSLSPQSNREDFIFDGQLINDDGNADDLTNTNLYFDICRQGCPNQALLNASIVDGVSDGISLVNGNLGFEIRFSPDEMAALCAGTYDVFMTSVKAGDTTQIISGTIPIVEGGPAHG